MMRLTRRRPSPSAMALICARSRRPAEPFEDSGRNDGRQEFGLGLRKHLAPFVGTAEPKMLIAISVHRIVAREVVLMAVEREAAPRESGAVEHEVFEGGK